MKFTFGAYPDAAGFWQRLSGWFTHRYLIRPYGVLSEVTSLGDLQSNAPLALADILASRQPVSRLARWS